MRLDLLKALNVERAARRAAVLVTDLTGGDQRLVRQADMAGDAMAEALEARLRSGKSGALEHEGRGYFLTVQEPPVRLVAIGAVHISQALAPLARIAGLDVTVVDPRTAFATPERFAGITLLAEWPDDAFRQAPLDRFTAVAALTHDPKIDDPALAAALRADCFYIGALGSRKTHAARLARLGAAGFGAAALERIRAPIGLDIGAVSPAEIAVSVLGEVIAALRRKPLRAETAPRVKFGTVPIADSIGAIAAHGLQHGSVALRKGEVVTAAIAEALTVAGARDIVVARLDAGDIGENEAARRLAEAVRGMHLRADRPFTGRCNLFAETAGVLTVDPSAIDRINAVDEAVTLATLPPFRAVVAGEMVATVKIIPFGVPGAALRAAIEAVGPPPLAIAPFRPLRVGMVSTVLPSLKASVIAKTMRVMAQRLVPAGATIAFEAQVAHTTAALASALHRAVPACDLVVVFGASAITDRRDVVPAGLVAAGGCIDHFGMPVDPGNLLLLGSMAGKPVLGAPGCARSPKENGFDWVLQRLLAGLAVTPADIRRLGGGGLLMEIVSRPQPRSGEPAERDEEGAS